MEYKRNYQKEISLYQKELLRLHAENIALAVAYDDLKQNYDMLSNAQSEIKKEK